MYCKFCGSQIDDAAKFCSKCGKSTNDNSNEVEEAQPIQNNKKKQAPFFVCLLVSVILGAIIGVLSLLVCGETGMLLFASIAAGIVFVLALLPLFANSHIRGILAFLAFILWGFIYYAAFYSIEEIATESIIQDIGFYFYICSPYAMLVLIWTELSRDNIGLGRIIKIIAIWLSLLLVLFLGFKIEKNFIKKQRESEKIVRGIKEESVDTQISTEETEIISATSTPEINDNGTVLRTLEESILSVYTVISDYMDTGKVLEINTDDLWVLYNNWDEIQKMDIFEKPIDMKAANNIVEFYYDNGFCLVWDFYGNTADIIKAEQNYEEIVNSERNDDMEESELSQTLFDSINYALSIGGTSNCDMNQENLKKLYEKIEDGSFFEESLFTYITEYGKERYNYEIGYDGLVLCVYYDSSEDLYGFDILEY